LGDNSSIANSHIVTDPLQNAIPGDNSHIVTDPLQNAIPGDIGSYCDAEKE
jgi:hypothetical protein